ncbi:MAG: alpha/beta fold hydrolase [Streptococcus sp.]
MSEQYELNLDLGKGHGLIASTASDQDLLDSTGRPACPLYWPRYQEEPEWRKEALKQLDPQIEQVLLDGLGHELYTEAPEIVAREVNNWLQNAHKQNLFLLKRVFGL